MQLLCKAAGLLFHCTCGSVLAAGVVTWLCVCRVQVRVKAYLRTMEKFAQFSVTVRVQTEALGQAQALAHDWPGVMEEQLMMTSACCKQS